MFEQRLLQKDTEIMDLRQSLDDQTKEYGDLLDVKLRLDSEIEAYRKLLESEEDRWVCEIHMMSNWDIFIIIIIVTGIYSKYSSVT